MPRIQQETLSSRSTRNNYNMPASPPAKTSTNDCRVEDLDAIFGISNLLKLPAIDHLSTTSSPQEGNKQRSRNLKTSDLRHRRSRQNDSAHFLTVNSFDNTNKQARSNSAFGEKQHLKTEMCSPAKTSLLSSQPKYYTNRSSAISTAISDQQTK